MTRASRFVGFMVLALLLGIAWADDLQLIAGSQLVDGTVEFHVQATSTNSSVKEYGVTIECETPVSGYLVVGDGIIGRFANTERAHFNKSLPDSGTYRLALTLEEPATCVQLVIGSFYFQFTEALPPAADEGAALAETVQHLNSLALELAAMRDGDTARDAIRLSEIDSELQTIASEACCGALAQALVSNIAAIRTPATLPNANPGAAANAPGADRTELVAGIGGELANYRLATLSGIVVVPPAGYQELEVPAGMRGVEFRTGRTIEYSFTLAGQPSTLMATLDGSAMLLGAFASGGLVGGELAVTGSTASASARREDFWTRFWRKREKCLEIQDQRQRERCIDQAFIDALVETVQEGVGL